MSAAGKGGRVRGSRLKNGAVVTALVIGIVGAWEGVRTVAYRDVVGIPTVCFGETRGVKIGDRYTLEECRVMLGEGVEHFEAGMRSCLTSSDRIPTSHMRRSSPSPTTSAPGPSAARRWRAG